MEYLQLFDVNNKPVNQSFERGRADIPANLFVKVAIIYIENEKGEFLIQRTSPEKKSRLSSTGGHVKFGADAWQTILEETKKELGIDLDKTKIKHLGTECDGVRYAEIFYIKENIDISKLTLQKEEVESVQWLSIGQIEEKIKNQEFIKSHGLFFEKYLLHKQVVMPKYEH